MIQQDNKPNQSPVTFRFRNIGPVKAADLELGNLTIIAGRNNTGKTYLVYTLYGFLKMWKSWPSIEPFLFNRATPSFDLRQISQQLRNDGQARFTFSKIEIEQQRAAVLQALARGFSKKAISQVFTSRHDKFGEASIEVVPVSNGTSRDSPTDVRCELPEGGSFSIKHDGQQITMATDKSRMKALARDMDFYVASGFMKFLLQGMFPEPFILSAERFGISLFYRELDFTKNQLVNVLQRIANNKPSEQLSPFLIIDRATSRYAMPIKDNIDYTRSIPDLRKTKGELQENKLFDDIKDMMEGYYGVSGDEIRFMSKARGEGRSFNIPLHLASSSVRGLSDLYFFLRHVAKNNQLLIIDEPESHLDTANQVLFARMLVRSVRTGLKVLVTTHSDYLIKEINNLVMLSQNFKGKDKVLNKLKYVRDDALHPDLLRAYVAENGGLACCKIDQFGIEMPVFDRTIDNINTTSNELASRLEAESDVT